MFVCDTYPFLHVIEHDRSSRVKPETGVKLCVILEGQIKLAPIEISSLKRLHLLDFTPISASLEKLND